MEKRLDTFGARLETVDGHSRPEHARVRMHSMHAAHGCGVLDDSFVMVTYAPCLGMAVDLDGAAGLRPAAVVFSPTGCAPLVLTCGQVLTAQNRDMVCVVGEWVDGMERHAARVVELSRRFSAAALSRDRWCA